MEKVGKPSILLSLMSFSLMIMFLSACGGTSSSDYLASSDVSLNGVAQKGFFEIDTVVTVSQFTIDGVHSGKSRTTLVEGVQGNYTVSFPKDWLQNNFLALVEVEGYFLDELTGQKSKNKTRLMSLTDNAQLSSINLLTHWESKRASVLIKKGMSFEKAMSQAHKELVPFFGISNSQQLDISQHATFPSDNALLLLLSGALMETAERYSIAPQVIIDDITEDFSADGVLTKKGDEWLLRMQSVIRDNPARHLNQYAKALQSLNSPDGKFLPVIIPLASRPVAIVPVEIFAEPSETIFLDGSASHDSGNIINYTWFRIDQKTQFNVLISNRFIDKPTITTPNKETDLLFMLVVVDEDKLTSAAVLKVIVRKPPPKNKPPIADSQSVETDEDTPVTILLTGSDPDPKDVVHFVIKTPMQLSSGILEGDVPNLTYTPTKDFSGTDSFTFMVNDGSEDSKPATVNIIVKPVNDRPMAEAGTDQRVKLTDTVILDGSKSYDVDKDTLSYQWTLTTRPKGSTAQLDSVTLTEPRFVVDKAGTYIAQLIVNDGKLSSVSDAVSITTTNTRPVANAGNNQTRKIRDAVRLDASASYDPDGDTLRYQWTLTTRPKGSTAKLNKNTLIKPFFVIDKPGIYIARLIVNDGAFNSSIDTVVISTINTRPVAKAGGDQTRKTTDTVRLDGSASFDNEGDTLSYRWELSSRPSGSTAKLDNIALIKPRFVIDILGTYIAQLTVNDGKLSSLVDSVVISTTNTKPVAKAGDDQTRKTSDTVILDGSASFDNDGDILSYLWELTSRPSGSTAKLDNVTLIKPRFVIDTAGTYIAQLTVNDGKLSSVIDSIIISTINSKPVAKAGDDQTGKVSDTMILDGSASFDDDGDTLSYLWELTSRPSGSGAVLDNVALIKPKFVIDKPGNYVARLIVNDGKLSSAIDTVSISTENTKPVAKAGDDQTGKVSETISLDGSASFDADGDTITYQWSLISHPATSSVQLDDVSLAMPSFIIDLPGMYTAQLIVNDGTINSAIDTVSINTLNSRPVAKAGDDQTAKVLGTVTLDGSASLDADGDRLTYLWSLISQPVDSSAQLDDVLLAMPSFVVDLPGMYIAQLIVNDGKINSAIDTVSISTLNSKPVAKAGDDQTGQVSDTIRLDGSASYDVDGDTLIYQWSLTSRPDDSTTHLNDTSQIKPSFVIDEPGTYIAQLTVNDGSVDSEIDTIKVGTVNSKPLAKAGIDQSVFVSELVIIDASASSDPDRDSLSYFWSFTSKPLNSRAVLADSNREITSFTVDIPGDYILHLVVNDGIVNSEIDTLLVTTKNSKPIANAGEDQEVNVYETVILDGSKSSDVDLDPLTYTWSLTTIPPNSVVTLISTSEVSTRFTPDVMGNYVVQLIVNDGNLSSVADTVVITAIDSNTTPFADAGDDIHVNINSFDVNAVVLLDGSSSVDADGDRLTYKWSFTTVPLNSNVKLSDTTIVRPKFTVDEPGIYIVQLTVNDGKIDSEADTVIIFANTIPIANAGSDQDNIHLHTNNNPVTVTLDGSNSEDRDGDNLTFSWSLTAPDGNAIPISDTDNTALFHPDQYGIYLARLIVNDGKVNSQSDFSKITVVNQHPIASAGPNQMVRLGETVLLSGSGMDPEDGDNVSFEWINLPNRFALSDPMIAGPVVIFPPNFNIPASGLDLNFFLIVRDTQGLASSKSKITITILPRTP